MPSTRPSATLASEPVRAAAVRVDPLPILSHDIAESLENGAVVDGGLKVALHVHHPTGPLAPFAFTEPHPSLPYLSPDQDQSRPPAYTAVTSGVHQNGPDSLP